MQTMLEIVTKTESGSQENKFDKFENARSKLSEIELRPLINLSIKTIISLPVSKIERKKPKIKFPIKYYFLPKKT